VLAGAPDEHAFDADIRAALEDTRRIFPVPEALVRAVMKQESGFRVDAVSSCGAVGLMQVMPFNARKLGLREDQLQEPSLNILAGVRLLAVLLQHYEGDVVAALIAYNSGPRPKAAPVPSNGETPDYVLRILRFWRAYERERASAAVEPTPRRKR
jgi:soluble lytic murein transglycosylase-like protein